MSSKLSAVVVGGTGAVGREVVGQLLCSPRWGEVRAVGRRPLDPPEYYRSQPGYDGGKLKQVVVNMENMEEEAKSAFEGADSVFCCLGTTRGVAGSADNFRKVDLHYVEAAARAASAGRAPHFALVSAQGAKAGLWASDLKPFHGLLYAKTKGQAEEAVKAQKFPYAAIMRPGLLERGDMTRGAEKLYGKLVGSVKVSQVAHTMVADAQRWHEGRTAAAAAAGGAAGSSSGAAVKVFEMGDIQKFV